ncbi:MAG: sulfatase-like hydrolase/transferase [Candidatus Omnitrophica bacterium]|nr:sulfatase-like hydrolase/transferase [Candidatus Omnitrophota bacterium]
MKRREFLQYSSAATTAGVLLARSDAVARSDGARPNIIFLMTDQQRWDALGVVNPHVKTPNLDRLAKSGVRFSQAVCQAPLCVASRNSLMFGYYPSQLGVRTNEDGLRDEDCLPSPPLPEILRQAGYQTAGFGKTHWGHGKGNPAPSRRGFEYRAVPHGRGEFYEEGSLIITEDDPDGVNHYQKETRGYGPGEEGVKGYIGCTSQIPNREHRDGWIAEKCLEFLDSGVDPNRPLFLYLSFIKPHAGFNVPKEYEDLYDIETVPDIPQPPWESEQNTHLGAIDESSDFLGDRYKEWREAWSKMTSLERRRTTLRYWANCSWLDGYMGQVLDRLKEMGRLENSIIVFLSDHGEMLGERHHRFSKYCLYDSSVRVPLILGGSAIPESLRGTIDDRQAELVDILPTLQGIAGIDPDPGLAGLDLLADKKRVGTFSEFHGSGFEEEQPAPAYMWRTEDWKLILHLQGHVGDALSRTESTRGELYDLKNDPNEWNNLYDSQAHSQVREAMKTELLMHLACVWNRGPNYSRMIEQKQT